MKANEEFEAREEVENNEGEIPRIGKKRGSRRQLRCGRKRGSNTTIKWKRESLMNYKLEENEREGVKENEVI